MIEKLGKRIRSVWQGYRQPDIGNHSDCTGMGQAIGAVLHGCRTGVAAVSRFFGIQLNNKVEFIAGRRTDFHEQGVALL